MVRGILAMLLLLVTGIAAWADAGRAPSITTATSPSLDYDAAYAAQARGDLDLAILFYDRVIRAGGLSDWDAAAVLTDRGSAYVDKGRLDRAIEDFDAAIKIEPDYSLAFGNRAIAYHRRAISIGPSPTMTPRSAWIPVMPTATATVAWPPIARTSSSTRSPMTIRRSS